MLWHDFLNPNEAAIAASEHLLTRRDANVRWNLAIRGVTNLMHSEGIAARTVIGRTCRHSSRKGSHLQPTELKTVLQTTPQWLQPIVGLAVSTGMRRSEILGLRRLDVDVANGRVLLPQTKNGEGRIVYLNNLAMAALKLVFPQNGNPTDLLFRGISPERISVASSRACRKVHIEDFRFHDLLHTAASWMRMQGADIHTVAQLLGHKDLRMAARYQHLSPAFLVDAVRRLDGIFGESCYPGVTAPKALSEGKPVSA